MSTVAMIAPPTFGGIVEGTPSGTNYTGQPGSVVAVQYADINVLAALGFTPAQNGSGVLNVGVVTPGASPYTYTNNDGYPETMIIEGGTVSAVALIRSTSTIALGATSDIVPLQPLDKVKVTYSVAPTMTKVPG